MSILEVNHVQKVYSTRFGGHKVEALADVSFTVEEGEYVAIMGESGSGKTTLLNILAALDRPTAGTVLLGGRDLTSLREKELSAFRRDNLGFVFQDFNLLDTFSLRDNILLPLVLAGMKYQDMVRRLAPLAEALGIQQLLEKGGLLGGTAVNRQLRSRLQQGLLQRQQLAACVQRHLGRAAGDGQHPLAQPAEAQHLRVAAGRGAAGPAQVHLRLVGGVLRHQENLVPAAGMGGDAAQHRRGFAGLGPAG